ncbi:glycosyltransferase family 4 protein [Sphingobium sp. AS12]|uniref:glycosyltransferase family 4 protein n=1 Tax=Sphingobium sp. AS12 TaxID=2849495 RepID=UPI001C31A046|nr:glycosyltransferase family 4 protein [Sphingobium sp. AS12]MBV2150431.1 glycosyltransferase family 4 protein [Sphingobium sp. AS12]
MVVLLITDAPSHKLEPPGNPGRFKAHQIAGDYFARAFRAQQLTGKAEALGARFVEARYHFTQAESEKDLREIAVRLEHHLRNRFSFTSPIPKAPEELEERIALLSALLKDRGPHAMEYHLARCLLLRGRESDTCLALPHIRRSSGPRAPAPAWVLRIQVEATLFGSDEAVKAAREGIKVVPPTQNLFSLYQAAAEILARDGKSDEAVTLLREGIGTPNIGSLSSLYQAAAEILARDGKSDEAVTLLREGIDRVRGGGNGYKLAESAILLSSDIGSTDLIDGFAIGPQQKVLAEVVSHISQGDFAAAANLAQSGIVEFPRYFALVTQGVFASVACGREDQARDFIRKWSGEIDIVKGSSVAWILALIEMNSGDVENARRYLDAYSGRTHVDEEVSLETLLRYWITSCRELGSSLSYHYPRIPTSISGLDHTLIRHQHFGHPGVGESAVGHQKVDTVDVETHETQKAERRNVSVLAVASEWSSGRGGLSTFNRQLCVALSQAGAQVACVVLEATAEEIAAAEEVGVTLVEAPRGTGLSDEQRLISKPRGLKGSGPDLLIGHGRITGSAAASLQANHYQSARRVHFVHMAPDEIEPYKIGREDQAGMRAQDRTEIEEELGRTATCVVAVGPRLHGRFATYLAGYDHIRPPLRFDPGFDVAKPQERKPPEGDPWQVLLLGRAEDVYLKGLDTAASAVAKAARERPAGLPRLELVIRGAKPDEMDQLRSKLDKESGGGHLNIVVRSFTVSDEKLGADLRRASLVLMPSRAEGFGLVGVEAIVAGTPVLVSSESGLGQLLREQLPAEQASRLVVGMDGDDHQLRDRWAGAIDRMLSDREASFLRATEIREFMAAKKTWRKEAEKLLAAMTT